MTKKIFNYYERYFKHSSTREEWRCVDAEEAPIPWITYPAIFQLQQYDYTLCDIFEWGMGYSTIFWALRSRSVTSIEHDKEWFEYVEKEGLENVDLNLLELSDYPEFIHRTNNYYDVIVIDGYIHKKMRYQCALNSVERLKKGGFILLDNSDWLPNTCKYLRDEGFMQIDFAGVGPINDYPWCTSIFHRGEISIPRIKHNSPGFLLGGIKNERD